MVLVYQLVIYSMTLTSLLASYKDPMSARRQAHGRLIEGLRNHPAVKNKLSPTREKATVNVEFKFWPNQVLSVDEVEQSVTTVGYAEISWSDVDLAWSKKEHEGIRKVTLPFKVWKPEIFVANSARPEQASLDLEQSFTLKYRGQFTVTSPSYLVTTCDLDLTYYPFDTQECEIVFLFLTQDVRLNLSRLSLAEVADPFQLHGDWMIIDREIFYEYYRGFTPSVRCKMRLKRSQTYYIFNLLIPMILTSCITLLVFWIPPSSGEKISFLVTAFVSNTLFLGDVSNSMPRHMQGVPRLTMYLVLVILECFLAMVATVFVMRRHEAEQEAAAIETQEEPVLEPSENLAIPTLKDNKIVVKPISDSEVFPVGLKPNIVLHNPRQTRKVTPPNATNLSSDRPNMKSASRHYIKARTWDMIFFVTFLVIMLPCLFVLYHV